VTSVSEMSLYEAAGTAIALLIGDPGHKYSYTSADWQQGVKDEYNVENFDELSSISGAWSEAKYEGSEETFEGLTAKVVKEYGGEGKGEEYWMVISLSDTNTTRYFRKDGWYASYDGGSLDGEVYEVQPTERTVVFYE
jgi:hypothetical protein